MAITVGRSGSPARYRNHIQMFEQQVQELKNRGLTVIGMQDFLVWKRGEKNIPPRCAIITFDDGWKSQTMWPGQL